jgi:hypothetical protein
MTLHIVYDHQCSSCSADYIPYDDNAPCPKCGLIETNRFDFIHRAVDSMRFNKIEGGSYVPSAWAVTSFGDDILTLLFSLYFSYGKNNPINFREFSESYLSEVDWGDTEYLKGHIFGIVLRVHEELIKG